MKTAAKVVILGFAIAALAAGAASAEAPSPRALELAKRYVTATRMDAFFEGLVSSMSPVLIAPQVGGGAPLSSDQRKVVEEAVVQTTAEVSRQMAAEAAPQLAATYSEKQLEEMVAFYESPTGQAVVTKAPELNARMLPMAQDMLPEIQARMQAKVCAKINCSAPTRSPSLKQT